MAPTQPLTVGSAGLHMRAELLQAGLWGAVAQEAQDRLNARCNDHQTQLFWRQRDGSKAKWQGCLHKWCHQGATRSRVCNGIVRCNCSICKHRRACLSASSAGFKVGQLPKFTFGT